MAEDFADGSDMTSVNICNTGNSIIRFRQAGEKLLEIAPVGCHGQAAFAPRKAFDKLL